MLKAVIDVAVRPSSASLRRAAFTVKISRAVHPKTVSGPTLIASTQDPFSPRESRLVNLRSLNSPVPSRRCLPQHVRERSCPVLLCLILWPIGVSATLKPPTDFAENFSRTWPTHPAGASLQKYSLATPMTASFGLQVSLETSRPFKALRE